MSRNTSTDRQNRAQVKYKTLQTETPQTRWQLKVSLNKYVVSEVLNTDTDDADLGSKGRLFQKRRTETSEKQKKPKSINKYTNKQIKQFLAKKV